MRKLRIIGCLAGLGLSAAAWAQDSSLPDLREPGLIGALNLQYGNVLRHSDKIAGELDWNPALSFDLSLARQTDGRKLWQQLYKYPEVGVAFFLTNLGNPEAMGYAYGIVPYFNIKLKQAKWFSLRMKLGTGIAYMNKTFNIIENRQNNAIASHINNLSYLSFGADWKLARRTYMNAFIAFKHHSNGSFKAPNLGLNVAAFSLGIKQELNAPVTDFKKDTVPRVNKQWQYRFRTALAMKESPTAGGPRYPVYIASFAVMRHLNHINRLSLGFSYSYNTAVYEHIIIYEAFSDNQRSKAMRLSLELGDEFLFGRFSLSGQVGGYLYNPFLMVWRLYSRLGFQCHFWKDRLFAGVYLKSHRAVADYVEFGMGVQF